MKGDLRGSAFLSTMKHCEAMRQHAKPGHPPHTHLMLDQERWKLYAMKSYFEIDTNQSIARVTLHGELIIDEFLALYEKLLLRPQFLPTMSVI